MLPLASCALSSARCSTQRRLRRMRGVCAQDGQEDGLERVVDPTAYGKLPYPPTPLLRDARYLPRHHCYGRSVELTSGGSGQGVPASGCTRSELRCA
eukprot:307841-Rhodomonas_salina.1